MATQTLTQTQPKHERINPRDIIGGFFGELMEDVTGIRPVNEGPVAKQDLESFRTSPEHQVNTLGMPSRGTIEFNHKVQIISQEIAWITSAKSREGTLQTRRAEINNKIGIGNASYVDTVKDDFTLRIDVQTDVDRTNSELSTAQLKAKRQNLVAQATGQVQRTYGADQKRNFEDQNMAGPG